MRSLAAARPPGGRSSRDRDGFEVDSGLERSGASAPGIEVRRPRAFLPRTSVGTGSSKDAAGGRFVASVVFYDGEALASCGQRLLAEPLRALSENAASEFPVAGR